MQVTPFDKILPPPGLGDEEKEEESTQTVDIFKVSWKEFASQLAYLTGSSIQVGSGIVLSTIFLSVNLHFAGREEDFRIMSGIGLGNVMINCSAYFLMVGLNMGFGSLFARAFTFKSTMLQRDYFSKGLCTAGAVIALMIVLMFFLEEILILMNQSEGIARYARQYAFGITIGTSCQFLFDFLRNFLNSMGIFDAPMKIQGAILVVHYLLCRLLCESMEMGITGIIIATNLSYGLLLIVTVAFIKYKKIQMEFDFKTVKRHYRQYIEFCLPVALPMVVDVFGFEINSILVGAMHIEAQFSAHMVCCNALTTLFSMGFGLGGSLCTLISNAVGENDFMKAKNYFKLSYCVITMFSVLVTFIVIIFGRELAEIYTSDEEVIQEVLKVLDIYKYFIIVDYMVGAQQGILKSMGLGKLCTIIFAASSYGFGTPMSYILGFQFELHLQGAWIGFLLGISAFLIMLTRVLLQIEWKSKVKEQFKQLQEDEQKLQAIVISELKEQEENDSESKTQSLL